MFVCGGGGGGVLRSVSYLWIGWYWMGLVCVSDHYTPYPALPYLVLESHRRRVESRVPPGEACFVSLDRTRTRIRTIHPTQKETRTKSTRSDPSHPIPSERKGMKGYRPIPSRSAPSRPIMQGKGKAKERHTKENRHTHKTAFRP